MLLRSQFVTAKLSILLLFYHLFLLNICIFLKETRYSPKVFVFLHQSFVI